MDKLKELLKKLNATDAQMTEAEGFVSELSQAAVDTEVAGLKKKNKELLEKYKNPDDDARAKLITLEQERDEARTDLARAQKDLETATKAKTNAEKERDDKVKAANDTVSNLLIDEGLTAAFAGAVKPAYLNALKLEHKGKFTVEIGEDGKPHAVASVKGADGTVKKLDPKAYATEWLGSADGKEWALVGGNSGGGAAGSGGGSGATGVKARYQELNGKKAEELTPKEQNELVILAGNPEATKA